MLAGTLSLCAHLTCAKHVGGDAQSEFNATIYIRPHNIHHLVKPPKLKAPCFLIRVNDRFCAIEKIEIRYSRSGTIHYVSKYNFVGIYSLNVRPSVRMNGHASAAASFDYYATVYVPDGSIKITKPRSGIASTAGGTEGVSKKPLFTRKPANSSTAHLRAGTSVPKSGLASIILSWYCTWYCEGQSS